MHTHDRAVSSTFFSVYLLLGVAVRVTDTFSIWDMVSNCGRVNVSYRGK